MKRERFRSYRTDSGMQAHKGMCAVSVTPPLNKQPVTELFVPPDRNFPVFCSGSVPLPEACRRSIHDSSTCYQLGERWGREEGVVCQPPIVSGSTKKLRFVSRPLFPSAARLSQTWRGWGGDGGKPVLSADMDSMRQRTGTR